jgi:hypothetical protein
VSFPSRTTTQGRDQQVLEGIRKDLQGVPTILLGTTTYTPATLAAFIQSRLDLANAIDTTRAQWLATVKAYNATSARAKIVLNDLRNYLIAAFGADSPTLADFGFSAPRKATLTPEQKAAAIEKALATRKARKTLGKRQKARIKGVLVTTGTTPATTTAAIANP